MSTGELANCDKKGSDISIYCNMADDPTEEGGSDCSVELWVYHKGVVGDLTLVDSDDKEELSTRDPEAWVKTYSESKTEVGIQGEQVLDFDYECCAYLNSMRSRGNARDILYLTGFITEVGVIGWRGKFRNYDRGISGPETGAGRQTFDLSPAACQAPGCYVRPVKVEVANAIEDYDPTDFEPYTQDILGVMENKGLRVGNTILSQETMIERVVKGLEKATNHEEVFMDVGKLIYMIGLEEAEKLVVDMSQLRQSPKFRRKKTVRQKYELKTGMAQFDRLELLEALKSGPKVKVQSRGAGIPPQTKLQGSKDSTP